MENKPPPPYQILCIGVNQVPGTDLPELDYTEKDAAAVERYFKTLKEDKAHVTRFTGKDATKAKITHWCKQCNASKEKLTVIVFFAGHSTAGKWGPLQNRQRCLWIDGNENIEPNEHQLKTAEILELLNNPLHQLTLIINACYTFDNSISMDDIFEEFKASERIITLKRYVIISSSAPNKWMLEDTQLKHGVLTYYFLRIISGKYSFFLKNTIPFFKLLQILEKKVKNHPFTTNTGRKHKLPTQRKYGVMIHYSDRSFQLPILEPIPFIENNQDAFQRKCSRLIHFFTRTRLRNKLFLFGTLVIIIGLLFYLVQVSTVRIHFLPFRDAEFHNNPLKNQGFPLDNLDSEMLGGKRYQEFNFYFFKSNWPNALVHKLNDKGKIILLGNLLGAPLSGMDEKQMLEVALNNVGSRNIFYWDIQDIYRLAYVISRGFQDFNMSQKKTALKLLAELGKHGKTTAKGEVDFSRESDQELRDLYLEHFYTTDFLEENIHHLNHNDYLYLLKHQKTIPPIHEAQLRKKAERYLNTVSESIPDSNLPIADKEKLWGIYKKLQILAAFGRKEFKGKASHIFRKAFDPELAFYLVYQCRNLNDKIWLLEQYFTKVKKIDFPIMDTFWPNFIFQFVSKLPGKAKATVIKLIINNALDQVPENFQRSLFDYLQSSGDQTVTLKQWENWLKKHGIKPELIFYPIINWNYENIFPFLENHYEYFKNLFTEFVFHGLYKFKKNQTVNLAKKIFAIGNRKDQLHAAVFLYNKSHPGYSAFLVEFLEKAHDNIDHRRLLVNFSASINETVIQLISSHRNLRERLKPLLNHPQLLYRFFKTNMKFWPEEVIHRIVTSKIPKSDKEGIYFLRLCEQLPDPHRKEMLVRVCKASSQESFRYSAENTLSKYYPGEFLVLVFNRGYKWKLYTSNKVIDAYQVIPYKELINRLICNLREKSYRKVGFICEALIRKKDEELKVQELKNILEEFDSPLERILLRKLRYYLHKRQFMEVKQ